MNYYSYLLYSGSGKMQKTYIGATTDPDRRLEQHNRERAGGARATKGREWVRAVYVGGFPDWVSALQFEWAWKRHSRGKYGLEGKLKGLLGLLNTERSTKLPKLSVLLKILLVGALYEIKEISTIYPFVVLYGNNCQFTASVFGFVAVFTPVILTY